MSKPSGWLRIPWYETWGTNKTNILRRRELKLLALKLNYKTKLRRMFTFCWGVRQTNNAAEHNMKLTINLLFSSFEQKQTLRLVRSVSRNLINDPNNPTSWDAATTSSTEKLGLLPLLIFIFHKLTYIKDFGAVFHFI